MQRVLEKMAKQLNEYDEASLMQLWRHYASQVQEFEPTKRWEEAAVALCLIQAIHWKNQLFNYHLAATAAPADKASLPPLPNFFPGKAPFEEVGSALAEKDRPKATVLRFPDKKDDETASPLVGSGDASGAGGALAPPGEENDPDV